MDKSVYWNKYETFSRRQIRRFISLFNNFIWELQEEYVHNLRMYHLLHHELKDDYTSVDNVV